jgi:hypothetical protein
MEQKTQCMPSGHFRFADHGSAVRFCPWRVYSVTKGSEFELLSGSASGARLSQPSAGANTGQTSAAPAERNRSYYPRPRVTLRSNGSKSITPAQDGFGQAVFVAAAAG